jgi:hypothetical protein
MLDHPLLLTLPAEFDACRTPLQTASEAYLSHFLKGILYFIYIFQRDTIKLKKKNAFLFLVINFYYRRFMIVFSP